MEITITSDGLRIEMLETEAGMFFESGKPVPTESGTELLTRLAEELGKLPNHVLIEGHTDSQPYAGGRRLYQLGAFGRPRQFGAETDAGAWVACRAGGPGARFRRPPVAAPGRTRTTLRTGESR